MNKPTVIIGASSNPEKYSYIATQRLQQAGHTVYPIGIKSGEINKTEIITNRPIIDGIDTVTLYVAAKNQNDWIDYIMQLQPKRIIFNPGTENSAFVATATQKGIQCMEACTLVMLSVGNY